MAVAKKGNKWYIVYSTGKINSKGNYIQKWVPTIKATSKAEALKEEDDFLKKLQKGITTTPKTTVDDLYNMWMEQHVKAPQKSLAGTTRAWYQEKYELYIGPVAGDLKLSRLTVLDLDNVLKLCAEKEKSDMTVRNVYKTMSAMFGWAKKKRVVEDNLMEHVDKPPVEEREYVLLKAEDFPKLLSVIRNPVKFENKRATSLRDTYFAMFLLELTTALRIDELCGLREDCLDFENKVAYIKKQVTKPGKNPEFGKLKNRRGKMVPLADMVIEELKAELLRKEERRQKSDTWKEYGLVFCNHNGGPIDSTKLSYRVFKSILRTAGLPDMRFHNLRHSVLTILAESNEDPNAICDLAGHSDPYFTKRQYIHSGVKAQRKASEKLETLVKNKI